MVIVTGIINDRVTMAQAFMGQIGGPRDLHGADKSRATAYFRRGTKVNELDNHSLRMAAEEWGENREQITNNRVQTGQQQRNTEKPGTQVRHNHERFIVMRPPGVTDREYIIGAMLQHLRDLGKVSAHVYTIHRMRIQQGTQAE